MSDELHPRSRRFARAVIVVFVLLVIAVGSAPFVLYRYGLSLLPRDALQAAGTPRSERVSRLFWASLGGAGDPMLDRIGPYGYVARFVQDDFLLGSAHGLSSICTTLVTESLDGVRPTRGPDRLLGRLAAYFWIGRNWRADAAIAVALDGLYFGHGLTGLDAAAEGYFGRTAQELDDTELLSLMVTTVSPGRLNPWCQPEHNLDRVARAFQVMGKPAPTGPARTLPSPRDACPGHGTSP